MGGAFSHENDAGQQGKPFSLRLGRIFKKHNQGPSVTDGDKALLGLKAQRKKLSDQQKLASKPPEEKAATVSKGTALERMRRGSIAWWRMGCNRRQLELRVDRHVEVARAFVKEKRQDKAVLVLRKKKLVERQLDELGTMQVNIESLISNVEMAKQQNKLFQVMKQGNEILKQLQEEVTVEDVQKLMSDTAEARAQQELMAEALSQTLTGEEFSEVEAEYEALQAEVLAQEAAELPTPPTVPPTKQTETGQDAGVEEVPEGRVLAPALAVPELSSLPSPPPIPASAEATVSVDEAEEEQAPAKTAVLA